MSEAEGGRAAIGGSNSTSFGLLAAATSWGLFWGSWAALLPEIQQQIQATDAQFGLALFGIPLGAVPAMMLTGPLAKRLRSATLPVVLVAFAIACLLPGLVSSPLLFAGALALVGAGSGALEVALNIATASYEARTGARLFNKVHAATPLAMVIAAPLVGLARQWGVAAVVVLLIIAVLVFLSAVPAVDRDPRAARTEPDTEQPTRRTWSPLLVIFGLIAATVLFMENAVEQWGAIHVENDLGSSPFTGSAAPACYMIGLFAGRLLAQWRGDRVPGRILILAGGLLGAGGLGLAALTGSAPVALAGFAVAGIGLAPAVPTLLELAGRSATDDKRPTIVATISTVSYLGFMVSPPLVGGMAGWWGLPVALTVVATGGLLVVTLSNLVRLPVPDRSDDQLGAVP